MSRLFGLARTASEYVRKRFSRQIQDADDQIEWQESSSYVQQRKSLVDSLSRFIFGKTDKKFPKEPPAPQPTPPPFQPPPIFPPGPQLETRPGAPPVFNVPRGGLLPGSTSGQQVEPPRRPPTGIPPADAAGDDDEEYDNIKLLGRDASYDQADWRVVMREMRVTAGSSNVYGYYFEFESRTMGILYVTFLGTLAGGQRGGPGPTYAYYNVPGRKYHEFRKAAETSAGNAVWDYLRVRGSSHAHQHQYRLIQPQGDYVPRKATPLGYRTRNVPALGVGRRSYRRSTLPERLFANRARPDRGEPNRGEPDRGSG